MTTLPYLLTLLALAALAFAWRFLRHPPIAGGKPTYSSEVARELQLVEMTDKPPAGVDECGEFILSFRDTWSLYSNSRRNLVQAHRYSLGFKSEELAAYMASEEETHKKLKRSLRRAALLRSAVYTRAALWLYVQERAIMSEMLDCYSEGQTKAASAR